MDLRDTWLDITVLPVVNYATQQNHVPVVRKLIVTNPSEQPWNERKLVLSANPDFFKPVTLALPPLSAGESYEAKAIQIGTSTQFLTDLTEKVSGEFECSLYEGENLINSYRQAVDVLPYDFWGGLTHLPEMVVALSTPNHSQIPTIVRRASEILQKWTGSPSFDEYQTKNPNRVSKQIGAVYEAIAEQNIVYCSVPASFEAYGQRVRLVDGILRDKLANCLDLSLLFAACLEAIGLHPLLVFVKGHAFVGAWLVEDSFADPVSDDPALITKRTADGINEVLVVEATGMNAGQGISFDHAVSLANQKMQDLSSFLMFVDVKRARFGGIRPLPLRVPAGNGWTIQDEVVPQRDSFSPDDIVVGPAATNVEKVEVSKQQIWERKLLDLSLRNSLLNIRLTKSVVQFITPNVAALEDGLADAEEYQVLSKPLDWELSGRDSGLYEAIHKANPLTELVDNEFKHRRLRTVLSEGELSASLVHIYRASRVAMEENGANNLYVGLGLLRWYETLQSERPRFAPLLLIPVEIIRKSGKSCFVIRSREEETVVNVTLVEMLRQDFGINIRLEALPKDDSGVDVKAIFNLFRHAVMSKTRWDVQDLAILGTFSFSKFILWNDIHTNSEKLRQSPLVSSLLDSQLKFQPEAELTVSDISDHQLKPEELALPISTDSSQLQAVLSAAKGRSFVLHGPPGTGKSQTITNIIANALFAGKKVLFVAAKRAALEVVEHRLKSIGIGPFCLELHSNKAKKSEVLDQLKIVSQLIQTKSPEQFQMEANRLYDLRLTLNKYVEQLHHQYPFGYSLFDLITVYSHLPSGTDSVSFPYSVFSTSKKEDFVHWEDLVKDLKAVAVIAGHPKEHPLAEWDIKNYSGQTKLDAKQYLDGLYEDISGISALSKDLSGLLKLDGLVNSYEKEEALFGLVSAFELLPDCPSSLMAANDFEQTLVQLGSLIKDGKKRDETRNSLVQHFNKEILAFPAATTLTEWKMASQSWFLPKWLKQRSIRKQLGGLSKSGAVEKDSAPELLETIVRYQEEQAVLDAASGLTSVLGFKWNNGNPYWEELEKLIGVLTVVNRTASGIVPLEALATWRRSLGSSFQEGSKRFFEYHNTPIESYKTRCRSISNRLNVLKGMVGLDISKVALGSPDWHEVLGRKTKTWINSLDQLRDWYNYRQAREVAMVKGLGPLVTAYEGGAFQPGDLIVAFKRGLYRSAAEWIIDKEPLLMNFSGEVFEQRIQRFRELSREFQDLVRKELYARLSAKIPSLSQEAPNSSEIGILQRAIRSNGRGTSIRKLFDAIPNLLPRLSPCILMSPISAAQYFELGKFKFDLLIFDEASQLPTSEAVGAMARAENVIIVGDPKQMPPTNFFSSNQVDEDNIEKEDLESILEECLALSMPSQYLLWHYRSKHESLIAFSNANYYENKLLTFPSPDDISSKVSMVHVSGTYDRANSRQNKIEAEAVVKELVRRLENPATRERSYGIVTFSSVQQVLIEDMLDKVFSERPDLEKIALSRDEPLFIKNLENVQGDERDVILFSICYGPDQEGKIYMNFGPINRDGGWRRLNVAVSRARYEMVVFSSMKSDQLDIRRTSSEGVANLRAFLSYAEKGKSSLAVNIAGKLSKESSFEDVVADAIRKLGYIVHTHVGASDYKMDIAVVDPANEHSYLLGILTDGRNYFRANTTRDREVIQVEVLRQLGWRIHKIWATEWWENPERVIDRVASLLESVKNGTAPVEEKATLPPVESFTPMQGDIKFATVIQAVPQVNKNEIEYRLSVLGYIASAPSEDFTLPSYEVRIKNQISQVLTVESPISKPLLIKRVLDAWGISRAGSRITAHMEYLFKQMQIKRTKTGYNEFLWAPDMEPDALAAYRLGVTAATRRNAEDIPAEEVAIAVREMLGRQLSMDSAELIRELAKLFGFARLGTSVDQVMKEGVKMALRKGYVKEEGGRVVSIVSN
jgi:hypothetical protein